VGELYEGKIIVTGSWSNATPEQIMDVIDQALHERGYCGCGRPPQAGYIIKPELTAQERRGYPDAGAPHKST
jgi:hypothetical protein